MTIKRNYSLLAGILLTGIVSCSPDTSSLAQKNSARLSPFGVSYEKITPAQAAGYKLLIVEPKNYNRAEVTALKKKGARVVAYLSVGEVNESRWYYPILKEHGLLGKNENWGSHYINLADSSTFNLFFEEVIPNIMLRGFDGLFLDTIDSAGPHAPHKDLQPYVVRFIERLRAEYPQSLIIQNAGLFVLDETAPLINAVLMEDVATHYDFNTNTYSLSTTKQFRSKATRISELAKKYKLPVLIVDFAKSDSLRHLAAKRLKAFGFPYFINTIELNNLSGGIAGNNH